MRLKNGDHCLLLVPGANAIVGIYMGDYEPTTYGGRQRSTHVKVDMKFEIGRGWKKFDKVDKPGIYLARPKYVKPYPVFEPAIEAKVLQQLEKPGTLGPHNTGGL